MRTKIVLGVVTAMLASGCAGTMTWDENVFPPQPTYSKASPSAFVAHSAERYEMIGSKVD